MKKVGPQIAYVFSTFLFIVLPLSKCHSESLDRTKVREYFRQIRELGDEAKKIANTSPCTSTADCFAIPFGYKECGGPSGYIVYSSLSTETKELENKVFSYNEQIREAKIKYGGGSNCRLETPPFVKCSNNICTKQSVLNCKNRSVTNVSALSSLKEIKEEIGIITTNKRCISSEHCGGYLFSYNDNHGRYQVFEHFVFSTIDLDWDTLLCKFHEYKKMFEHEIERKRLGEYQESGVSTIFGTCKNNLCEKSLY